MEKNRKARKGILIVLLLVVVGLSIGFAGFTDVLNITTITANVEPDANTFNVAFSTSNTEHAGGEITTDGKFAQTITLQENTTEIQGLTAKFTEPGQTATWELYAYNGGEYTAFLNSVSIGKITATPGKDTDGDKVNAALADMSLVLEVGGITYEQKVNDEKIFVDYFSGELEGHVLEKETSEKITVKLIYGGSVRADGDFDITVGEIALNYGSIDTPTAE